MDDAIFCEADPDRRIIAGVKIDVEGNEHLVVKGAKRVWQALDVPIVAYENDMLGVDKRKEVLVFFLGMGYRYGAGVYRQVRSHGRAFRVSFPPRHIPFPGSWAISERSVHAACHTQVELQREAGGPGL